MADKGKDGGSPLVQKGGEKVARLTNAGSNPSGVMSGMTKRLAITDGTWLPSDNGKAPGDEKNPLRAKRS